MKSLLTTELQINGLKALQEAAISDHSYPDAFEAY